MYLSISQHTDWLSCRCTDLMAYWCADWSTCKEPNKPSSLPHLLTDHIADFSRYINTGVLQNRCNHRNRTPPTRTIILQSMTIVISMRCHYWKQIVRLFRFADCSDCLEAPIIVIRIANVLLADVILEYLVIKYLLSYVINLFNCSVFAGSLGWPIVRILQTVPVQ